MGATLSCNRNFGTGALLSCLTGASMASVAMLGSALTPEMEKRGYKKAMSLGPILGSGGLAIMIPPSGLAVLVATLAKFLVGKFLIAIIMPGVLMAVLFCIYVVVRCTMDPSLAPSTTIYRRYYEGDHLHKSQVSSKLFSP